MRSGAGEGAAPDRQAIEATPGRRLMMGVKMMRGLSFRPRFALAAIGALLLALVAPAAMGSSRALAQGNSVTISPTQGPPGTTVTATGSSYSPGDEIQAIWGDTTGPDVGSPVTVNSSGDFTATFAVPSGTTPGSYQVIFWDETEQDFVTANEEFTVTQASPPPAAPAAPSGLKVVPYGALDFYITWTSNSTNQSGFQVYNGVTTQNVTNPTQYYDLWAVANPSTYDCFAVRAYNSNGYSAWAGVWTCATTPPGGAPAAPTNVVATGYSTSAIEISFVNQANNETAFLFNNGVTTATYNSYSEPGKGSSFAVLWTGLKPGTYMCFMVAAYNQWGRSAYVPSTWACASSKS